MKIQKFNETNFWLDEPNSNRLKLKYNQYLMNKYDISYAMLTYNRDTLELNFTSRKYENPICRDRLQKIIEDFRDYNWYIKTPYFYIPMSNKAFEKYFKKIDDEIQLQEDSKKYNI